MQRNNIVLTYAEVKSNLQWNDFVGRTTKSEKEIKMQPTHKYSMISKQIQKEESARHEQ